MLRIKLVFNPLYFQGSKNLKLQRMKEIIRKRNFSLEEIPVGTEKTKAFLLSQLETVHAIIVVGGDGTLNLVINTLLRETEASALPPLGVLPEGTANDFAHQLSGEKYFYSLSDLLTAIEAGRTVPVDVGFANGFYFINVIGAGMLVDIAHTTSHSLKKRWGMSAYYSEGLRRFFTYKPFTVRIRKNGNWMEESIYLFLVLNSKGAGGFLRLVPSASFNDGKLDLFLVKDSGCRLGVILSFMRLLLGFPLKSRWLQHYQVEEVKIEAPSAVPTDIDGEAGPPFPLSIRVLPGLLHFFQVTAGER